MSDPVRNAEIEDVLSSIRRLVTTDPAPAAAPPAEPAAVDATDVPPPASDRFVLTPALRVQTEEETTQEDTAEASDDNAPQVELAPVDLELEAFAGPDELDWIDREPEGPAPEEAAQAAPLPEPQSADQWESISLEERIAELEAAVALTTEEWEPDGSEMEPGAKTFEDLKAAPEAPAKPAPLTLQAAPLPADDDHLPPAAEPEAASAEDDSAVPPAAAEAAGPDQTKAEIPPELSAGIDDGDEDEPVDLDEDMLRDMVAEIVREELQGRLGERITRNVRKLVRREINRALASRDFE